MAEPTVKASQPVAAPVPAAENPAEPTSAPLAAGVEGPAAPQQADKPKGKVLDRLAVEAGVVMGGSNFDNGEGVDHVSVGFVGGVYGRFGINSKKKKEGETQEGETQPAPIRNRLLLGAGVSYRALSKKPSNSQGAATTVFAHLSYLREVNPFLSFGPYLRLGATIFTTPGCASFSEFTPDLCDEGRFEVSGKTEADKITLDGKEAPPAVAASISGGMRFAFLRETLSLDVGLAANVGAVATVSQLVGGDKNVPFSEVGAQVALNFDVVSAIRWGLSRKEPKKSRGDNKSLPVGGDVQASSVQEDVQAPSRVPQLPPQLTVDLESATIAELQQSFDQNIRSLREWVVSDDNGETKLSNVADPYLAAHQAGDADGMAFELGQLRDVSAQMSAFYQETHEIYSALEKKIKALPEGDSSKDQLRKDLAFAKTQFHGNRDELFFSAFEIVQELYNAAERVNKSYLEYQKNHEAYPIEFDLEAPKALEKAVKSRPNAKVKNGDDDQKGDQGSPSGASNKKKKDDNKVKAPTRTAPSKSDDVVDG